LFKSLARYVIGWRGYIGFCQTLRILATFDAHIRRKLRPYLWRQWRIGRNRFRLRIPGQADHRFRQNPITDSGRTRSPIPVASRSFFGVHQNGAGSAGLKE
jgi:hypothetical protein